MQEIKKSPMKFITNNAYKRFETKLLNPYIFYNNVATLKSYRLEWIHDYKKDKIVVIGKLNDLLVWLINHYDKKCKSIVDVLKYVNIKHFINKMNTQKEIKIIKKVKEPMIKKKVKITKVGVLVKMLETGKKCKICNLANKVFGEDTSFTRQKIRRMVSDLRCKKYMNIKLINEGIYQLI